MSLVNLPRLYFAGQMYWNPSTLNNNDYGTGNVDRSPIDTYKAPQAKLNGPYLATQDVESDAEFKEWVIKPTQGGPYKVPPAEWDYYGGNQCGFVTNEPPDQAAPRIEDPDHFGIPLQNGRSYTRITGYTDVRGTPPGPANRSDPWWGLPLQLNLGMTPAKMVDVNPQSPFATQIFADTFTVGSKEQGQGFTAPVRHRMATRWLYQHTYNLDQALMIAGQYSAVFQNVFRTQDIRFFAGNPAPGSLQAQLQAVLDPPTRGDPVKGLMVRITVYDTLYFQGDAFAGLTPGATPKERTEKAEDNRTPYMERLAQLYQQYETDLAAYKLGKLSQAPKAPINRAYSYCVGWMGPWQAGEPATTPGGRFLIPFEDPAARAKQIRVQPTDVPDDGAGRSLGPVAIQVQPGAGADDPIQRLSVDLGSAIPVLNTQGARADFGTLQLGVHLPDGPLIIADLPYDKGSYENTSGVVDLDGHHLPFIHSVTRKEIAGHPLFIQVFGSDPAKQTVALNECPFTAETDLRGVYVDQPKPAWKPSAKPPTFTVKVWHYGGAPPADTQLGIVPSDDSVSLSYKDQTGRWRRVSARRPVPVPDKTDAALGHTQGEVTIRVKGVKPGLPLVQFYPLASGEKWTPSPDPFYAFYTAVRVLPFHNLMAQEFDDWLKTGPDIDRVNRFVFRQVYGTYHLMYPVMSFIGDPLKFQEWRGKIMQVTDPACFESARYMPVMRALSAGQQHILTSYVDYLARLPHPTSVKQKADRITR